MTRMVKEGHWLLADSLGPKRKQRLLDVPEPTELVQLVLSNSTSAAMEGRVNLEWIQATEAPGHFRLETHITITELAFDWLFNGRSGYRAQYYLSPEEGVLFNRSLMCGFERAVRIAYTPQPGTYVLDADQTKMPLVQFGVHLEVQRSTTPIRFAIGRYKSEEVAFGKSAESPTELYVVFRKSGDDVEGVLLDKEGVRRLAVDRKT